MTGLIVALLAAAVYSIGLAIEQRALHRAPAIGVRRPLHLARTLLGNRRWLAGCGLAAAGSLGLVIALGLAPVSVVQPAYAGGIAVMLLGTALVLGDPISRGEKAALTLMPAALLLLSLSLGDGGSTGTVPDLPWLLGVSAGTVVLCVAAVTLGSGGGRTLGAAALGAAAGLSQGVAGLQGKALGGLLADEGLPAAIPAALASPYPYLYAAGWAVGIVLFQTSMQRARASITAPVANVTGNVFTVVLGTLIFSEPLPDDPVRLALRIAGFALTLLVVVLVRGTTAQAEADTARLRSADSSAS
ncbi:hypothetical protein [Nocardiopsis coralliicola]